MLHILCAPQFRACLSMGTRIMFTYWKISLPDSTDAASFILVAGKLLNRYIR